MRSSQLKCGDMEAVAAVAVVSGFFSFLSSLGSTLVWAFVVSLIGPILFENFCLWAFAVNL